MIYFQIINNKNGQIIAENIKNYARYLEFEKEKNQVIKAEIIRSGYIEKENYSAWIIVVGREDLVNSKKRFINVVDAYISAAEALSPFYTEKIEAHSHTLRTLQGQMSQKVEGFAKPKKFRGKDYNEQKEKIREVISENQTEVADLVCYLKKE